MRRPNPSHLVFTAAILLALQGCASSGGRTPGSQATAPEGEQCAFEVLNQTTATINLMITGATSPTQAQVNPGGRYRFERPCDLDRVVVSARRQEGPQDFGDQERRGRAEVLEQTVRPEPGQVVRIPLRW